MMHFNHSINKERKGFTIVELLIVIVVIGTLAGIVIIAYNGVREKAEDVRRASALDQYVKALQVYKATNGHYPIVANERSAACLGDPSLYPADGIFAEGVCYTEGPTRNLTVDNDFNAALKSTTSTLPNASQRPLTLGETGARGAWFTYSAHSDTGSIIYLEDIKRGLTCPHGELYQDSEDGGATGYSQCYIPIE